MIGRLDESRTQRLGAAIVAIAGLAAGLSGCGWTPRDEYLTRREVTVAPQAGDGSRLISRRPDDPFRAQSGHATVADGVGQER